MPDTPSGSGCTPWCYGPWSIAGQYIHVYVIYVHVYVKSHVSVVYPLREEWIHLHEV